MKMFGQDPSEAVSVPGKGPPDGFHRLADVLRERHGNEDAVQTFRLYLR
jgi:hypothetical protein